MLESFLVGGAQKLDTSAASAEGAGREPLVYGQSVTDACMEWGVTEGVLAELAGAARSRRTAA
jgi:3-deoxy-7-phosphoheptulonate synthase